MSNQRNNSISGLRVRSAIWPILISVAVLGYLFSQRFDLSLVRTISIDRRFYVFVTLAIILVVIRVLAYTSRLYLLTKDTFSFLKSFQLMLIWHFSSAVSPTSVGGAAVALLVLSQERLGAARTAAVVIYTVILDAIFLVCSAAFCWLIWGKQLFGLEQETTWKASFFTALIIMIIYGAFFIYGAFIQPKQVKKLLYTISQVKWLGRFTFSLQRMGDQFPMASKQLRQKSLAFHLNILCVTAVAWICRFLVLLALIWAFDVFAFLHVSIPLALAQIESLYLIMAFSPTPGGSGIAELLFTDMMGANIPNSLGIVIATSWRILSNYIFLLIGAIIIPIWFRSVLRKKPKPI